MVRVIGQETFKTLLRRSSLIVLAFLLFLNICLIDVPSARNEINKENSNQAFQLVK